MSEIRFTLKGVFLHNVVKKSSKFHSRVKKKGQTKFQTNRTNEGYSIKTANTLTVKFDQGDNLTNHCWWDHHPFDNDEVRIPYKCEKIDGVYHTQGPGSFCNMFCLWAYLREEQKKEYHFRDPMLDHSIELTKFLFEKMYPADTALKAAPHWKMLQKYGGPLTIVEFRKSSYEKIYIPFRNVVFDPTLIRFLTE